MNRQEKIDKINEVVSDKSLTFWCRIILKDYLWEKIVSHSINNLTFIFWFEHPVINSYRWEKKSDIKKIIWHKVMVWNVLKHWKTYKITTIDWGVLKISKSNDCDGIFANWEYLDRPIEDQSDDCIDFIINLID